METKWIKTVYIILSVLMRPLLLSYDISIPCIADGYIHHGKLVTNVNIIDGTISPIGTAFAPRILNSYVSQRLSFEPVGYLAGRSITSPFVQLATSAGQNIPAMDAVANNNTQNKQYLSPQPFDHIMQTCRKSNNYDKLIDYVDDLTNSNRPISPPFLTKLISCLGEGKQLGRAISLIRYAKVQGLVPNEIHYGALINAARKVGQWEIAYEIFQRLPTINIKKNAFIYNSMIMTLGEANQHAIIDSIIDEIMNTNPSMMSHISHAAVISSYEKCGQWQKAVEFFKYIFHVRQDITANEIALNAALSACRAGGEWLYGLKLLIQAESRGIFPDAISFTTLIFACGESRQFEIAKELFLSMNSKLPLKLCRDIYSRYAAVSADMMNSQSTCNGPIPRDTGTYNALITAYEKNNQWQDAVNLLIDMLASQNPAIRPDVKTFTAVIKACSNVKKYEIAWKCYKLMDEYAIPKDTGVYNTVIHMLQSAGRWDEAREVVTSMDPTFQIRSEPWLINLNNDAPSTPSYVADMIESKERADAISISNDAEDSDIEPSTKHLTDINTSTGNMVTIDLHGLPQQVAFTAIDLLLQQFYDKEVSQVCGDCQIKDVKIITGRGRHVNSRGTRRVLRPAVENFISSVIQPTGILSLRYDDGNDGCLYITSSSIKNWIEKKRLIEKQESHQPV